MCKTVLLSVMYVPVILTMYYKMQTGDLHVKSHPMGSNMSSIGLLQTNWRKWKKDYFGVLQITG